MADTSSTCAFCAFASLSMEDIFETSDSLVLVSLIFSRDKVSTFSVSTARRPRVLVSSPDSSSTCADIWLFSSSKVFFSASTCARSSFSEARDSFNT